MRIVALLLFACIAALAQSPDPADCAASGTVVNSVTGTPIPRARVTDGHDAAVTTDDIGRWSFEHLPCGDVNFKASRQTFLADQPAHPQPQHLIAGTPMRDIKIALTPQAVITGTVVDDQSDPIQRATVAVMSSHVVQGRRRPNSPASGTTNDIGEFRIAGLPAGKYIVCANGNPGEARAFATQCSPGPADDNAVGMQIRAGAEERLSFQLNSVALHHVQGTVSGAPAGVAVQLTMQGMQGTKNLMAPVRDDGSFDFTDASPGLWMLGATAFEENDRWISILPVEVRDSDVNGLQVHLERGVNVSGRVRIVSASGKAPNAPDYMAGLNSSQILMGPTPAIWSEDHTSFTLPNVMPGSYRVDFRAPAPFYMKSATLDGRDIANTELPIGPGAGEIEVVLSDECGSIEGIVSTDDKPTAATILLQSDQGKTLRVEAGADGHFKLDSLRPGDYKVYAWDDATDVEYANPVWMQRNAKGTDVTVSVAQTAQVNVIRQTAPPE